MMEYTRELKKDPGEFDEDTKNVSSGSSGRWGTHAIRKVTTKATSPKLLNYRSCVAGELRGKDFDNLADVQEAFYKATQECKS